MTSNERKTVCFFGIYDPTYARNRVLMTGFKENGYTVTECRVDPKVHSGLKKFWQLWRTYRALPEKKFDHVIVAFPGHGVMWLAYLLFGRAIIFDAFLSLYDSNVHDRKVCAPVSAKAFLYWVSDWYACALAKTVLLDTNQHIDYFVKTFKISKKKFQRVFIGAEDALFTQSPEPEKEDIIVEFHGNFIPLQGIPYIIEAAEHLRSKNIEFHIIGTGGSIYDQVRETIAQENLEKTIRMIGKVPYTDIPKHVSNANICLGIFGDTQKTQRVIPNKVYECIAAGRAVITADTPAMREVFEDRRNVLFSKTSDGADLAARIEELAEDAALRRSIAKEGRVLFEQTFTPFVLVRNLLTSL